jgi:hypothetical protein
MSKRYGRWRRESPRAERRISRFKSA